MSRKPTFTRARAHDPETSVIAAESIEDRITAIQKAVLRVLKMTGSRGMTDKELSRYFANPGSTYRTRRAELVEQGLVKDTGVRRKHDDSPRWHIVWAASEFVQDFTGDKQPVTRGKPSQTEFDF